MSPVPPAHRRVPVLNLTPFLFIAFTTLLGALFGATLIGATVGVGIVVLANLVA